MIHDHPIATSLVLIAALGVPALAQRGPGGPRRQKVKLVEQFDANKSGILERKERDAAREWLKENRDAARRFVKSAVDAIALLKNDKQAAFRTLKKWYQMTDPELQEHLYAEAAKLPSKPYPPYDGLKRVMEVYDSHEMRKYKVEHFYDDSFVRELDESGYIDSLYEVDRTED